MTVPFVKYQGTGNDFIMVDNRDGKFTPSVDEIARLCDRRFGIGSDGLILIESTGFSDFYMNFFNPDGSQSFCGNGSRCAVKFAQELGIIGRSGEFAAIDTKHDFISTDLEVSIRMKNVLGYDREGKDYVIQTGSPHYIRYVEDVNAVDIIPEAHVIRYGERFGKAGINVNFVQVIDGQLHVRTYERGVEAETLSCGTGVTAMALSYAIANPDINEVVVHTRGGQLKVTFEHHADGTFENIWLIGPATKVFTGTFEWR